MKFEESSNLKKFIEITPKNKPIKNSISLSSVLFPRTINLDKNDYFKDFGLKKNNKFVSSFLSSNEETNHSLNSQRRINSDIYERLKKEDENFIKTLLRLKEKINNNNSSISVIPENRNLSTKSVCEKKKCFKEILPNKNNKKKKSIKIIACKRKINLFDSYNKKDLSSHSLLIKPSNTSSNSQKKTKGIINSKQIIKTKTINSLNNKSNNKNNNQNIINNSSKNIFKSSMLNRINKNKNSTINHIYKKNINGDYKVERKLNKFSKEKKITKIIPTAFIDLFD